MQRYTDWLRQAERNLKSAEANMQFGIYEEVCYESQQVAEKAVVALLDFHHMELRGHYLVTLQPPHALGVWTPVQVSLGGSGVVGIIAYALSRLEEGNRMGNGNNWDDRTRKVFT